MGSAEQRDRCKHTRAQPHTLLAGQKQARVIYLLCAVIRACIFPLVLGQIAFVIHLLQHSCGNAAFLSVSM